MRKIFGHGLSIFLIVLICYGIFLIFQNSYSNLQDYQFVIQLKSNFIENKQSALIDVIKNRIPIGNPIPSAKCVLYNPKSLEYKNFVRNVNLLKKEDTNLLIENLFTILSIPNDIVNGLSISSHKKFLISLFSTNYNKSIIQYKFNFINEINDLLKNGVDINDADVNGANDRWFKVLKNYKYKNDKLLIDVILGIEDESSEVTSEVTSEIIENENSVKNNHTKNENSVKNSPSTENHNCWIDGKFNLHFFSNSQEGFYSVLPSVISIFLIGVFILVTIITISLFIGIYVFAFVKENSILKGIFLNLLNFYESLPEPLFALFSLMVVKFVFHTETHAETIHSETHSILFISLILSLIILPKIVKIVMKSLNLSTDSLNHVSKMTDVKILISEVLPLITPYIIYRVIKILSLISNFGIFFLMICGFEYSPHAPHGFHGIASSLVSDIFISLHNQNQTLISSILVVLMLMNLFFYAIALFVKRFVSFQFFK